MGSLNLDGSIKVQTTNRLTIRHRGDFLTRSDTPDDNRLANIANSGTIRTGFDSRGVAWQPGGTASTSGLAGTPGTQSAAFADTTIERAKHTANGQEAGFLQQHVTRARGTHVSVSDRQAISNPVSALSSGLAGGDTLGPMQTISERKVFFLDSDRNKSSGFADWTIFDSTGDAVGADSGTSDTDKTPNEGLLGK